MKLIYGSVAAKHWYPDFRDTNDLDYISSVSHSSTKEVEYHWTSAFKYLEQFNIDREYVDPDFLYTIKVSHAAWDVNWVKTMKDIHFLQNKGCTLIKEFYNLLIEDWKVIHGPKKVKLSESNYDFFEKDNVKREYDHDSLHEMFKFNDRPMHERIRKDLNSPMCSEELFNQLSDKEQYQTAMEELRVIMYERYLIKGLPFRIAKTKALKNLITSMTTGWFNLYLIINSERLINDKEKEWLKKIES